MGKKFAGFLSWAEREKRRRDPSVSDTRSCWNDSTRASHQAELFFFPSSCGTDSMQNLLLRLIWLWRSHHVVVARLEGSIRELHRCCLRLVQSGALMPVWVEGKCKGERDDAKFFEQVPQPRKENFSGAHLCGNTSGGETGESWSPCRNGPGHGTSPRRRSRVATTLP
jgi:hypothetical protein